MRYLSKLLLFSICILQTYAVHASNGSPAATPELTFWRESDLTTPNKLHKFEWQRSAHISLLNEQWDLLLSHPLIGKNYWNDAYEFKATVSMLDTDWLASIANLNMPEQLPEKFDKQKWQQWPSSIDVNLRLRERWDLLQSYQLVGMSRREIADMLGPPEQKETDSTDVDYYRLNSNTCGRTPAFYLEFKYSNNRVCAFRTEHYVLASSKAANYERFAALSAEELKSWQHLPLQPSKPSPNND
jgi:hypothetical protein